MSAERTDILSSIYRKFPWLRQIISYGLVGVSNSVVTIVVIYVCLHFLGLSSVLSNILGYAAGVVNSFVWNSKYTFQSRCEWRKFVVFVLCFLICYLLQLGVLIYLDRYHQEIFPMVRQLVAMVVFNVVNFIANKVITFRER